MSTIRCIYTEEPKFPATDQHPDAVRYRVAGYIVDALEGEPTPVEIDAVLRPPAAQKTMDERLAPLGVTVADLKAELAK